MGERERETYERYHYSHPEEHTNKMRYEKEDYLNITLKNNCIILQKG